MPVPRTRRRSLRRRLLLLLAQPVGAVLALATIVDFRAFKDPVQQAYDLALSDAALGLALNVQVGSDGRIDPNISNEAHNLLATDRVDDVFYRIDGADGKSLAGEETLPTVEPDGRNPSITTVTWRSRHLRIASYRTPTRAGTVTVTVAETLGKRNQLESRLLRGALWSDVLGLVAILACVWLSVRVALRPLDSLAEDVGRRRDGDLTALGTEDIPAELQGLVNRLNELLATVAASSRAERQFLESAAHQLRTPLAGVLAQLELLAESEPDASRRPQLRATLGAAQALAHTTHQLLSLARAEYRAHSIAESTSLDLCDVAVLGLSGAAAKAAASRVELAADLKPARITGVSWLLNEAVANLIDNAITYTPAGGCVTVNTGLDTGRAFVEVVDTGPGIAVEERSRVVNRFYRGTAPRGTGSGLGLAIVSDVAARHDATLSISDGDNGVGTRVRLTFPPAGVSTTT